jgi:exodeoxyribonuclease VII small subunit
MNTGPRKPRSRRVRATEAEAASAADAPPTFEEALASLEQVVEDLERGELGLSDSLARYEQGVKHLKQCFGQLEAAERRVELLRQVDAEGHAITDSFDEEAMSLEQKAASRGVRRSAPSPGRAKSSRSGDDDAVDGSAGLF